MKLSDEDRTKRGRDLAELLGRRAEVADEKAKVAADYTADLKRIDHRIARLAWSVSTGLVPEEERQGALGFDEK
ncbi:MAG TPA: hypothetical protein ENH33_07300 [Actinobacteria bacterium]|nr:hypothetical protein [Actinomycetota bacterium]